MDATTRLMRRDTTRSCAATPLVLPRQGFCSPLPETHSCELPLRGARGGGGGRGKWKGRKGKEGDRRRGTSTEGKRTVVKRRGRRCRVRRQVGGGSGRGRRWTCTLNRGSWWCFICTRRGLRASGPWCKPKECMEPQACAGKDGRMQITSSRIKPAPQQGDP